LRGGYRSARRPRVRRFGCAAPFSSFNLPRITP
jgi:hypothetical protein